MKPLLLRPMRPSMHFLVSACLRRLLFAQRRRQRLLRLGRSLLRMLALQLLVLFGGFLHLVVVMLKGLLVLGSSLLVTCAEQDIGQRLTSSLRASTY